MLEFNHKDDIYYFLWGMLFMFLGYSLIIIIYIYYPRCKRYIRLRNQDKLLFGSYDIPYAIPDDNIDEYDYSVEL